MSGEDPTLSRVLDENLDTEKRHDLIEEIEDILSHIHDTEDVRLISYVATDSMYSYDVKAFEDMLQAVDYPDILFLLINSPGGDPETALRIIHMCRERSRSFRTIIPDMAKSAATQVCLGSEEICMGFNSELGPIDPQIQFRNEWTAAYTILDGLEFIEKRAKDNPDVPIQIYQAIAQHYDPAKVKEAEKAIEYIRSSATDIAGNMFANDEDARNCVERLLEMAPHDRSISLEAAADMGLVVFDMRDYERLWAAVWELYIRSDNVMSENQIGKLWETREHTISFSRRE